MAKLTTPANAGFNAGKNFYAKHMRIDEIVIDSEISQIFDININVKNEILRSIKETGYDESQPVVIWKGTNILVDGRTRYTSSKEAGLEEIPINEKTFVSREDAILYSFAQQAVRRQLSSVEVLKAAEMLPIERNVKGQGRAAEQIAKRLGVSPATIYQANSVLKNASDEDIQAVKNGKMSLKKAYNKNKPNKTAQPDMKISNEEKKQFLLRAVTILVEYDEETAAEILINEYLPIQKEQEEFANLLPEDIGNRLAIW